MSYDRYFEIAVISMHSSSNLTKWLGRRYTFLLWCVILDNLKKFIIYIIICKTEIIITPKELRSYVKSLGTCCRKQDSPSEDTPELRRFDKATVTVQKQRTESQLSFWEPNSWFTNASDRMPSRHHIQMDHLSVSRTKGSDELQKYSPSNEARIIASNLFQKQLYL